MDKMNILFTSVGRRSYLIKYFLDELNGNSEIHVANSSEISPVFQFVEHKVVTPLIYSTEYIPFLMEYCKVNRIKAIIPLFDIDLFVLAQNKEKFLNIGVTVIVSDLECIEICNDKWKTYEFLRTNKYNTPLTFNKLEDALISLEKGEISYPVIVKPRWGMGSIGVFEASNKKELEVFVEKTLFNIKNSYLKYESAIDLDNSVLIQEKLLGKEYGLDIINDLKKEYQNTIVKEKFSMRAGETDCAVTVEKLAIKELGRKLSKDLQHIANLDVDIFEVNDNLFVLEMNARFGGGYPFSHMAGVNLPKAIVKWLDNEEVNLELLTEKFNIMSHKDIDLVIIEGKKLTNE